MRKMDRGGVSRGARNSYGGSYRSQETSVYPRYSFDYSAGNGMGGNDYFSNDDFTRRPTQGIYAGSGNVGNSGPMYQDRVTGPNYQDRGGPGPNFQDRGPPPSRGLDLGQSGPNVRDLLLSEQCISEISRALLMDSLRKEKQKFPIHQQNIQSGHFMAGGDTNGYRSVPRPLMGSEVRRPLQHPRSFGLPRGRGDREGFGRRPAPVRGGRQMRGGQQQFGRRPPLGGLAGPVRRIGVAGGKITPNRAGPAARRQQNPPAPKADGTKPKQTESGGKKTRKRPKKRKGFKEQALSKPWVSEALKVDILKKYELLEQAKKANKEEMWKAYQEQKAKVDKMSDAARLEYVGAHPEVNRRELQKKDGFFCDTCDRGFPTKEKFAEHNSEHVTCGRQGCTFTAHVNIVSNHILAQHITGLYTRIAKGQSKEEVEKWVKERSSNYPTFDRVKVKALRRQEMETRGERIPDDQQALHGSKKRRFQDRRQNGFSPRNQNLHQNRNPSQYRNGASSENQNRDQNKNNRTLWKAKREICGQAQNPLSEKKKKKRPKDSRVIITLDSDDDGDFTDFDDDGDFTDFDEPISEKTADSPLCSPDSDRFGKKGNSLVPYSDDEVDEDSQNTSEQDDDIEILYTNKTVDKVCEQGLRFGILDIAPDNAIDIENGENENALQPDNLNKYTLGSRHADGSEKECQVIEGSDNLNGYTLENGHQDGSNIVVDNVNQDGFNNLNGCTSEDECQVINGSNNLNGYNLENGHQDGSNIIVDNANQDGFNNLNGCTSEDECQVINGSDNLNSYTVKNSCQDIDSDNQNSCTSEITRQVIDGSDNLPGCILEIENVSAEVISEEKKRIRKRKRVDSASNDDQPDDKVNASCTIKHRRYRPPTFLEKLLAREIRHERNVILQCIRYVVENNFFDKAPMK